MRLALTPAIAGLLAFAVVSPARAQPPEVKHLTVRVGETARIQLAFPAIGTVCDDLSLMRVEDGGSYIRVVGVKAGRTQCGFWRIPETPLPAVLYEITVTPAR